MGGRRIDRTRAKWEKALALSDPKGWDKIMRCSRHLDLGMKVKLGPPPNEQEDGATKQLKPNGG